MHDAPCISATVGGRFEVSDQHLLTDKTCCAPAAHICPSRCLTPCYCPTGATPSGGRHRGFWAATFKSLLFSISFRKLSSKPCRALKGCYLFRITNATCRPHLALSRAYRSQPITWRSSSMPPTWANVAAHTGFAYTMGGVESFVMCRLCGNKTQDFWEIMNSCHFFTFLFPLLAVPLTSSW